MLSVWWANNVCLVLGNDRYVHQSNPLDIVHLLLVSYKELIRSNTPIQYTGGKSFFHKKHKNSSFYPNISISLTVLCIRMVLFLLIQICVIQNQFDNIKNINTKSVRNILLSHHKNNFVPFVKTVLGGKWYFGQTTVAWIFVNITRKECICTLFWFYLQTFKRLWSNGNMLGC